MPFGVDIPNKAFFKIGEVSDLLQVKPYVLRYWESEFQMVRPGKTPSGHRTYSRKDVLQLAEIRYLLYTKRFTIEGARKFLRRAAEAKPERTAEARREVLARVAADLEDLLALAAE